MDNIFSDIPGRFKKELFETIVEKDGIKIERIVSLGQKTPEGEWLSEAKSEWVVLVEGSAVIFFEGEKEARELKAGDHLMIGPGQKHRVEWTDPDNRTVWLAVYF
ncbi:MAG: cupin domain-containing protein [Candidatus Omnitrophota bacterium]